MGQSQGDSTQKSTGFRYRRRHSIDRRVFNNSFLTGEYLSRDENQGQRIFLLTEILAKGFLRTSKVRTKDQVIELPSLREPTTGYNSLFVHVRKIRKGSN